MPLLMVKRLKDVLGNDSCQLGPPPSGREASYDTSALQSA